MCALTARSLLGVAAALAVVLFSPTISRAQACGSDQWSALPASPLAARESASATWSGSAVFVWGGWDDVGPLGDGASFDPAAQAWSAIGTAGAPSPRRGHTAVWTGSRLIVWGGEDAAGVLGDGASYDPATQTWTALTALGAPSPRRGHAAVWTGSEMIVWGGEDSSGQLGDGASYDPATDTWSPISAVSAPSPRAEHTALWTGTRMLVWGGGDSVGVLDTGASYDPATDGWTPLSVLGAPAARMRHTAVWDGTRMLIWGGSDGSGTFAAGAAYDPAADTWAPLDGSADPSPRERHGAVWTGYQMIVWGGSDALGSTASGGRYEPVADAWTPTATGGAPSARSLHATAWTGRQMFVWGGRGAGGVLADGGLYCGCSATPAADDAVCDGIDSDCDGSVDEDYAGHATSCGVGACAASGTTSCVGGAEQDDCQPGAPAASDTTCDGVDDDCDGSIDESYQGGSTSCGVGECAATGSMVCNAGVAQDNCQPAAPGVEVCDGLDNDCDGSVDEDTGTRYVAEGGVDAGNNCLDQLNPCGSINYAVSVACDFETVSVAEGRYVEDVLIDHPVTVDGEGVPTRTILNGTGATDVVRIHSSDVHWTAVNVYDTVGVACMHIGDAAHTGLRRIKVDNTSLAGCSVGAIWESTGSVGDWNYFMAASTRDNVYDGSADSGIGTLMIGGNGRIQFKVGHLMRNDGPGLVVRPASGGLENREIVLAGEVVYDNGQHPSVGSHHSIEIHQASDVRFEGNDLGGPADVAVLLDQVTGGTFYCNKVHGNGDGLRLEGGTTIDFSENHFTGQTGAGVRVGAGTGTGLSLERSTFTGNAQAMVHAGDGVLSAPRNWWGAADGPSGSGPGTGDPVTGSIDSSQPFGSAPMYVRRPTESGWEPAADGCFQSLQSAIDAALVGEVVVVGPGSYREHLTLDKQLTLEGIPNAAGCSPSEISGRQSGTGPDAPVLRITGVSGVTLRNLTLRDAGEGVTCGQNAGDEIGLDLQDVSDSTFSNLCLEENGVTELRVYGNSNNNLFENLTIDGMLRDFGGADVCGHRSKTGILIDGGAACEGGPGVLASGNRITGATISNTTRAIALRLTQNTEVSNSVLSASPAAAWAGEVATGIAAGLSSGLTLADNQVSGSETEQGIRLEGLRSGDCATEATDTSAVTLSGGSISGALSSGLRLYRAAGDPGSVHGVSASCVSFSGNAVDVEVDDAGGADPSRVELSDLLGTGDGIVNHDVQAFLAERNWWGSADGPSGGGPGTGSAVQGAVTFGGWLASSSADDADGDGSSECAGDCDDTEPAAWPGNAEVCDEIDNDCDGSTDEGFSVNSYWADADGDGFGDAAAPQDSCLASPPAGSVADDTDCDDTRADVYPAAAEVCDAVDNDCDGSVDEGLPPNTYYLDGDGDGYGDTAQTTQDCAATPPAGYSASSGDCNDADAAIHPGAAEICDDGIDNNCDGLIDGQDAASCPTCVDGDADGYLACDGTCLPPAGGTCGDCDDSSAAINPLQSETCNGIDDNCDGGIDEGFAQNTYYTDADGDGFGDAAQTVGDCRATPPAGTVTDSSDCDDTDAAVHPGAAEVCDDGIDNNCDGLTDTQDATTCPPPDYCPEADGDGYAVCDGVCQLDVGQQCGDCLDSAANVYPGAVEYCDGLDNDCDGSVDEDTGTRYVAEGGVDAGNNCLDQLNPCGSINYAVSVACDFETVSVAEGRYVEDVLIDHPVTVDGEGVPTRTILNGTGATDVVRIHSSDVHWTAVNVYDTVGVACMHIGDAAHTGLRRIKVDNTSLAGCSIGAIWESTGSVGDWNYFMAASTRDNVYDGSADSGIGTLMIGGNGRIQFKVGHLMRNDGPGLVVRPASGGLENREIVLAGEVVYDNGQHPSVGSHHSIEIHQASDVRFEGNDLGGPADVAVLLDQVTGGTFYCNKVHGNGDGLRLEGGTTIDFSENHFTGQTGAGVRVGAGTGTGLSLERSTFTGNAQAMVHAGDGVLSAPRNWWGAADGPSGSGPGTGDPVTGSIDSSQPFGSAPMYVRRPTESGWEPAADGCFQSLQSAIDAALVGEVVVVGPGSYREHLTLGKSLTLEGIPNAAGCSASEISGRQSGTGPDAPALRITGVSGVTLRNLTLRDAGEGVTCGQNAGDEIGLDLQNVSDSTFSNLCLEENGVTELRVYGNSNNNLFENLTIDGMLRDFGGADVCGHRSKTGILIDGGAACEGGPGVLASSNRITGATISNTTRAIALRLTQNTEVSNSVLSASPAAAWAGEVATGIAAGLSSGLTLTDNQISGSETEQGIRLEGLRSGDCATEATDTSAVTLSGGSISGALSSGLRLYRAAGDPGSVHGVSASCVSFSGNAVDVEVDDAGGADPNRVENCDLAGPGDGIVNHDTQAFLAERNWWGAADGPSGGGPGSGSTEQGAVDYAGWLASSSTDDADADGFSECAGDCNDSESSAWPGAAEICLDGIDNSCDGLIDGGEVAPAGIASLTLQRSPTALTISWGAVTDATGYDVDWGDLATLVSGKGDLGASVSGCLLADVDALSVDDDPGKATGSRWYLHRARSCGGLGSYASSASATGETRDAQLGSAPAACP